MKILEAANEVFKEKGYDGTSMQEIADKAGVNKSMLHYYYRSKDKLFHKVFQSIFSKFVSATAGIFSQDLDILEKIRLFIDTHIDFLMRNPDMPAFIIHEIRRNPELIADVFKSQGQENLVSSFFNSLQEAVKEGKINPVDPVQLLMNIISMNLFPFAAKNIVTSVFQVTDDQFTILMNQRKSEIFNMVKIMLENK
ncbi:MAG: TetR/AcrR family transcriptional regulator [Candidatus Delongbacteria bacterium]|nr:TetR/AcrR family transcriptional regulator [Candidatus Delongbacteria bacterium]